MNEIIKLNETTIGIVQPTPDPIPKTKSQLLEDKAVLERSIESCNSDIIRFTDQVAVIDAMLAQADALGVKTDEEIVEEQEEE